MRISAAGLALIKRFEGFSGVPYRCPAGLWTVGYGHVLAAHELIEIITKSQAEDLLAADVRRSEWSVSALVKVAISQSQFDALVSFVFNVGAGAFERSTLRRVVNREDHEAVPEQFMRWVYAGGRKLPGLVRRRFEESMLYADSTS